jgi:hypothetical protein
MQRHVGTTGKRTKIRVPARRINEPGSVWQGPVIRNLGLRVQHKDIVGPSRLIPLRIVRGLGQLLPEQFTPPYLADSCARTTPPIWSPLCRNLDTEEEIAGRGTRAVEDDMG